MKKLIALLILLCGVAASALAADLPMPKPKPFDGDGITGSYCTEDWSAQIISGEGWWLFDGDDLENTIEIYQRDFIWPNEDRETFLFKGRLFSPCRE